MLLTNEDGIDGPGLAPLAECLRAVFDDIWIVPPRVNLSARGRTFSVNSRVRAEEVSPRLFAVEGTPVDCIILGLNGLLPGARSSLVLGGVNEGQPRPGGRDIGHRRRLHGGGRPGRPRHRLQPVRRLHAAELGGLGVGARPPAPPVAETDRGPFSRPPILIVNYPEVAGFAEMRAVPVGKRTDPVVTGTREVTGDGRVGFYVDELEGDGATDAESDIDLCLQGFVSVAPLYCDPTDMRALSGMKARLEG